MPDQNKRINDLLERYVNKTISAEDFAELFDYIARDENKQILEDYMKQSDKIDMPNAEVHHIDWQNMYDHIVSDKKDRNRYAQVINIGRKLTIAASLILVSYLGYKIYHKQDIVQPVLTVVKQDLTPGGDKAILKLGDGSEIILTDAQNGILTQQGNANINKSDEGFVEYSTTNTNEEQKTFINTLSTPRGGQYKLMLPDRTLVWLNAESSITFPTAFIGNERKVKVTGEVYFEVAKDKGRRFIVENGQTNVEVLGTHFNVNFYPNEDHSAVTLLEGSVKVTNNNISKLIVPGQQALFSKNSERISLKNVDIDNVVDWKNGLFIFEDADIEEVMRQIERWYDVDVSYSGKIPDIKFNGVVSRNNNVSKLIKLLQQAGNLSFNIENKTIKVKQINK